MSKKTRWPKPNLEKLRRRWGLYVDRAIGGAALIVVHETTALHGHWTELNERVRTLRRSQSPRGLIRDQLDLLPESRSRLLRDQEVRLQLWRGLTQDLAAPMNNRRKRR